MGDAIPSTPESPYAYEGARSSPCDVVGAWSNRDGTLGELGLPKRPAFKRASGSMVPALSPVLSVGSVDSAASTPKWSPMFSMTPPVGVKPRKRRPSAERQPLVWSPLSSTPEGSRCEVSATPLQASVMMQDRMSRGQAPGEADALVARLAALLPSVSSAVGGRVQLERRHTERAGAMPAQGRQKAPAEVAAIWALSNAKPTSRGPDAAKTVRAAATASPWTCFVVGVHALLGCKLQD